MLKIIGDKLINIDKINYIAEGIQPPSIITPAYIVHFESGDTLVITPEEYKTISKLAE